MVCGSKGRFLLMILPSDPLHSVCLLMVECCRDELRALEEATNEKAAEGAESVRCLMQQLQVCSAPQDASGLLTPATFLPA